MDQSVIDETLIHEAAHIAMMQIRNVHCISVFFLWAEDELGGVTYSDCSSALDDALIICAPWAVGDEPSEFDLAQISPTMKAGAKLIVMAKADLIKEHAEIIVREKLNIFAGGLIGTLYNPLESPTFIGA